MSSLEILNQLNSLSKASLLNDQMMEKFILLNISSFSKPIIENINCLVQRSLGPVLKLTSKKQIRHWRSRMIARNLDSEIYSSSNYNLIVEDNIKKIIYANVFPEVPLLFQTQFSYLVDKYKKDYVIEKEAQQVFEKYLLEMLN